MTEHEKTSVVLRTETQSALLKTTNNSVTEPVPHFLKNETNFSVNHPPISGLYSF